MRQLTFLQNLYEMQKIKGTQYGSTPGGLHVDDDGETHYVKYYGSRGTPDQAHVEVAASNIYELLGARTVKPKMIDIEGHKAAASKWNTDLVNIEPHEFHEFDDEKDQDLVRHYIAAVLTKNWDSVGLDYDNIRRDTHTGELVTVDTGGSFHFRAMGGHKDFTPDAKELDTLRHNYEASGDVYTAMFKRHKNEKEFMLPVLTALKSIPDSAFLNAIKKSGIGNSKELAHILVQRKDAILQHYGIH